MISEEHRWWWIAIVALIAAAIWWLVPRTTGPGQAPARFEPPDIPKHAGRLAEDEATRTDADAPPTASPLPREQIELPDARLSDAGVALDDGTRRAGRRGQMLTLVLERLRDELATAEEAGDEERATQLRIRIERLERLRTELTGP